MLWGWAPYLLLAFVLTGPALAYFGFEQIWPKGVRVGDERFRTGLIALDPSGRTPPLFTDRGSLEVDYRFWIQEDQRRDSSHCLNLPDALVARMRRSGHPRPPGEGGAMLFAASFRGDERLVKGGCDAEGRLFGSRIVPTGTVELRPVACARDTYVAHGFTCPAGRRSAETASEIFGDYSGYYPREALRLGMEGPATVRVRLDRTGSPVDCEVLESSGHDLLDRHTCKIVGTDPAFTVAARDGQGDDLSRTIRQRVVWQIPRKS